MTSQNMEVADTEGVIPVALPRLANPGSATTRSRPHRFHVSRSPLPGRLIRYCCQYFNKYKNFNVCPNEDGGITWQVVDNTRESMMAEVSKCMFQHTSHTSGVRTVTYPLRSKGFAQLFKKILPFFKECPLIR